MIPILQFYSSTAVVNVRTAAGLDAMTGQLQRAMRELDPRVPFYNVSHLADHTKAATFQQKLAGDLLVVFGALALALAGIGSYGVLSYLVGMRRREIGIRLAVGATQRDVFRLIAGSGARLIGVGLVIGLLLSIGVGMGLQSLLIGIEPTDPITYAGVIGVLTIVAAAACLLPARQRGIGRSGHDASRRIKWKVPRVRTLVSPRSMIVGGCGSSSSSSWQ